MLSFVHKNGKIIIFSVYNYVRFHCVYWKLIRMSLLCTQFVYLNLDKFVKTGGPAFTYIVSWSLSRWGDLRAIDARLNRLIWKSSLSLYFGHYINKRKTLQYSNLFKKKHYYTIIMFIIVIRAKQRSDSATHRKQTKDN